MYHTELNIKVLEHECTMIGCIMQKSILQYFLQIFKVILKKVPSIYITKKIVSPVDVECFALQALYRCA